MSIVITELIKEQTIQCFVMGGAGIAFMLFYQICSFLSRQAPANKWIRAALELLFWFLAAIMLWQFLYYCAYGSLSIHTIAAFGAGVLLWKRFFYGIIIPGKGKGIRIRGFKKTNGKEKKKQSV